MRVKVFATPQMLGEGAAADFAVLAREAILARGAFSVALSGGSTPKLLYRALRSTPVQWGKVFVYFSDERTVPPDSEESNFKLARDELLSHVPIPESQIFRMAGELDPHEAAALYEAVLPERLDLTLLGMGDDGHTASLFPGTGGLGASGRVIANWVPKLDTWRLSFTFEEINAARERWLLVSGENKAHILRDVQRGEGDYPVERVTNPLWYLDAAAARELD